MALDWAAIVEREGTALAAAAGHDLAARVPSAPGWDTAHLLRHVGLVHRRTSVVLSTGTMERPTRENGMLPEPPASETSLLDWFRDGLTALVADIRQLGDPDRPVYSFVPTQQRAGFWPRRMVHETTIHRIDAEQAAGGPVTAIEPAVGVDGVDEVLMTFVPAFAAARSPGDGRTVHLHCTDAEGEWLVRFAPGAVEVEGGHAKGDAAVRGRAGDLHAWLWGRLPLDRLEVFGDPDAAHTLRVITTF